MNKQKRGSLWAPTKRRAIASGRAVSTAVSAATSPGCEKGQNTNAEETGEAEVGKEKDRNIDMHVARVENILATPAKHPIGCFNLGSHLSPSPGGSGHELLQEQAISEEDG